MVKLKRKSYHLTDGTIDIEHWLQTFATQRAPQDFELIRQACLLAQLAGTEQATLNGVSCLQQGLAMAELLLDLNLDPESIAAAIVYSSTQYADLSLENVSDHLGKAVAKLVRGVKQMDAMPALPNPENQSHTQVENLRKMFLAMVDDVRVVLIKLAERTHVLRAAYLFDEQNRTALAKEAQSIYAPLANRLGIGQVKWELEDLAFRYLEPELYKKLAKLLDERRVDREKYIEEIIGELNQLLKESGIQNFTVTGRAKHIYSIYRKMHRKKIDYDKIYDISAVRILVNSIEDCYNALGLVHSQWERIPREFDDYIATPKENGYRSIHTAVIGPAKKNFEVQIRTHEMHQESELGVAAHWRYKEGGQQKSSYENKILWLRQVLEWQKEVSGDDQTLGKSHSSIFEDRIYVFTPTGDVVELSQHATPLDFAYHIHSEVGHRCRGAKVNGNIVQLTYALQTGDRVEILTTREPAPSRDWLNPHLGYLKTPRAKAKVQHWFKLQDFGRNLAEGKHLFERELHRLHLSMPDCDKLADKLHYKSGDELLAALGGGHLRVSQILHFMNVGTESALKHPPLSPHVQRAPNDAYKRHTGIHIQGVGNLLTYTANCCMPLPGDPITGYITMGHGVAIHHQNCANILEAAKTHKERLIEVDWGTELKNTYPVSIFIAAHEHSGLLKEINAVLSSDEKTRLISFHTSVNKEDGVVKITITLEMNDLAALGKLIGKLEQLPHVISVKRQAQH